MPPVVHAAIGLTIWAVMLLGLERWQRHCGQKGPSQPGVAEEAEDWLRDHNGRTDRPD